MTDLLVPLAVDPSGRLVRPAAATRGQTYSCPSCGQPIIAKLGDRRVRHFAHAAGSNCSLETLLHKTAKRLVVQAIADALGDRGPRPVIVRA